MNNSEITKIEALITYSNENIIVSFDESNISLKTKFQNVLTDLLAHCQKEKRTEYQQKKQEDIHLLDFYIEQIKELEIISTNVFVAFIEQLAEINNLINKNYHQIA